jgi:hypothetical protein
MTTTDYTALIKALLFQPRLRTVAGHPELDIDDEKIAAALRDLQAKLAEAERDARRYRWLREHAIDNDYWITASPEPGGNAWLWGDRADAAIDAALALGERQQEGK